MNILKLFLYSLFAASCLSLVLCEKAVITAQGAAATGEGGKVATMPEQCRLGKTSTETIGWRWKPGTQVKVYYLKGNFSEAEAGAFSRAITNWNQALREINSQIVFVISGERESVATNNASLTVLRGIPRVTKRVGETRFHALSNGVVRLTVTINPVVTDLSALQSLLTHELGHSLGLADCYKCRRGTTAMSAFKSNNQGNDVYEPSACDKYVVAAGYADDSNAQARLVALEQR